MAAVETGPSFDLEFEIQILAEAIRDKPFMREAAPLLDRRSFTTPQHAWVWNVAKDTWSKFGELPTGKVFISRVRRDFPADEEKQRTHLETVAAVLRIKPTHAKVSLDELRQYTKVVALQASLEASIKACEHGDWEAAYAPLRALVREEVRPAAFTAVDWFEGFERRQVERKHRRDHPELYPSVPTGIRRLDRIMGGLQYGEIGLVLGTTGKGKSILATHFGFTAAWRGHGVIHFSGEMSEPQVSQRYDSRWSGMLYSKFKAYEFGEEELERLLRKHAADRKRLERRLRIVAAPPRSCTIHTIRDQIRSVRAEGRKVDLVVLDSADHLISLAGHTEVRLQHADVYWGAKALAAEEGVAIWSTAHAAKEFATRTATAEAAAESYDKSRIADAIVSINAPSARTRTTPVIGEDDDEDAGAMRPDLELFLAKYRDGESHVRIPLETDFARMLIREAETLEREAA